MSHGGIKVGQTERLKNAPAWLSRAGSLHQARRVASAFNVHRKKNKNVENQRDAENDRHDCRDLKPENQCHVPPFAAVKRRL